MARNVSPVNADPVRGGSADADIIAPDLRLLIVAINPATRSAAIGHPFSSPGNPFWRLLHVSGLTPVEVEASRAHQLLEHGIGLTSTVRRATRTAGELPVRELRAGAVRVEHLVRTHRPETVALLGLTLYPQYFPTRPAPGPGPKPTTIAGSRVFVLPNPSGRNRSYAGFDAKLAWYQALARTLGPPGPPHASNRLQPTSRSDATE
ncbi:mismatch-specific DNA-glycosylase [Kineosporia sp. A_224]|uniref:mismatch-specific DNA-glycosylase n=1 Tax=Kineosporia sp. A_224 TaxID=1962180 RepID=UPI001303F48F|nr:mismatch-specific DNA-glycosylase [Kineosporia sp. A_224]